MKVGRNDICPCGSGKKYKRCHLNNSTNMESIERKHHHFSGIDFDDTARNLSLFEKNMTLIEGIIDIFGFIEQADFKTIKSKVSREKVAELYKLIAWLWPPDTNVHKFLPSPSANLRGLYMGNMRPETILNSVGRYSLYCDEILVMNPFLNPWFISPKYNPLIHPEDYIGETWKWVLFTLQLVPWIQDRQVLFLPNPLDFDSRLRNEMWTSAESRLSSLKTELDSLIEQDDPLREIALDDFKRTWMSMPEYALKDSLLKYDSRMSEKEIKEMIDYINRLKESDPYFINNPNEKGAFGIKTFQSGGNLEQGLYISQLTGAHMYTDLRFRWKEILSTQINSKIENPWSPITYGFQKLDFKFLENIDLNLIHKIKSDGRLHNFRNFLRKTWINISDDNVSSYEEINKLAVTFTDELNERYSEAESEWDDIDRDLKKWALGRGGLGSILATGGINWMIPALGFALEGINKLVEAQDDRKRFKKNVPLSVFIDLKK